MIFEFEIREEVANGETKGHGISLTQDDKIIPGASALVVAPP
jgi:hypothetical protein